jgi:hypothetical protein
MTIEPTNPMPKRMTIEPTTLVFKLGSARDLIRSMWNMTIDEMYLNHLLCCTPHPWGREGLLLNQVLIVIYIFQGKNTLNFLFTMLHLNDDQVRFVLPAITAFLCHNHGSPVTNFTGIMQINVVTNIWICSAFFVDYEISCILLHPLIIDSETNLLYICVSNTIALFV